MKTRVFIAIALGIAIRLTAHAQVVVYSDDFEEFSTGTALSQTNYVPSVGAYVNITNENTHVNSTTVVATNFLGSAQALFEPGTLPYQANYEGYLAEAQVDQVLTLSFTLWIPTTVGSANHFGGFGLDLMTTAVNDVSNTPPLLLFNDDGQVLVSTNNATIFGSLDLPDVPIGNWSALAGTITTNVLVLNYPAGTFSFSINGAALTNMAIPGFFTNVFDAVRLTAFEAITNAGIASLGNSFALGDVQVSVPTTSGVTSGVDLAVSESVSANSVTVGDTFSCTIILTNRGSDTATGIIGTGSVSSNLTVISVTGCGQGSSQDQCALGTLASGASTTIVLTVTAAAVGQGCITTSASANETDVNPANNSSTICLTVASAETCTFTLSASSVTLPAKGSTKTVKVKAKGASCSWTAVSDDDFITIIAGATGSDDGTVDYSVSGNTNTSVRSGTITIAGETFTVKQAIGGCTFSLSPKDAKFKAAGGSATVKVKANLSDCAWTATTTNNFITITAGASGVGNDTVSYTVAANTNTTAVTGSITIGGETFTITQAGAK